MWKVVDSGGQARLTLPGSCLLDKLLIFEETASRAVQLENESDHRERDDAARTVPALTIENHSVPDDNRRMRYVFYSVPRRNPVRSACAFIVLGSRAAGA